VGIDEPACVPDLEFRHREDLIVRDGQHELDRGNAAVVCSPSRFCPHAMVVAHRRSLTSRW
jgi:hypothetical protein